jgi:hypothetical protein
VPLDVWVEPQLFTVDVLRSDLPAVLRDAAKNGIVIQFLQTSEVTDWCRIRYHFNYTDDNNRRRVRHLKASMIKLKIKRKKPTNRKKVKKAS